MSTSSISISTNLPGMMLTYANGLLTDPGMSQYVGIIVGTLLAVTVVGALIAFFHK